MSCDKRLRDIWSSTDQEIIDAMQESGKCSQNPERSNQGISFNDWCDAQERNTETLLEYDMKNGSFSRQFPNRLNLKNYASGHHEGMKTNDTASLESIWAPTIKDDLLNNVNHGNPLLNFKFGKQEVPDPISVKGSKANDSYESVSSTDSESELSNNCGSQDELNEETFGKFAAIPEEFRPNKTDLSDLSETTLLWDSHLKNSNLTALSNLKQQPISDLPNPNCSTMQISTNNEKSSAQRIENKTFRKKRKRRIDSNPIKSVQQSKSFQSKFRSNHNIVEKEIFTPLKKGDNSTKALHANFFNLSLDYETLNPKQGKKIHVTRESNRKKQYSSNAPRYRQIFPEPTFKETLAIETREIIERRGDSQRLTTQKIIYVQGKEVDKVSFAPNIRQGKIRWDNNISISATKKEARIVRANNLSDNSLITGQNNIQRSSSVDKYITSSHDTTVYHNLQNENIYVKNNGGARPKDLNPCKRYNSFPNADPTKKDHPRRREYLNTEANNHFKHPIEANIGLFSLVNHDETLSNNDRGKHKRQNLEKEMNNLIRNKFHTSGNSENSLSWNIIDSESNEEQSASKPYSTRIENPNNKDIQTNVIRHEKRDYEMTPVKEKNLSGFQNAHNTTPKVANLQNNLQSDTNDKTDKLYSSEKNKFSPSFEMKQYDERKKSTLIKYAKDMADLIVGCERALSVFKSFYDEWAANRSRSIDILEQIVKAINSSSKRGRTIKNILAAINVAAAIGDVISPNKAVSVGLRITTAIVGTLSKLVGDGMSKKDLEEKEFEIREIFQQDIDASSSVYICGLQCGTQFQETCSVISEFHQCIQLENFIAVTDDEDVKEFLNEISEFNPSNFFVFYKRLKLNYEKLMLCSESKESKAFCRVFEDVPEAVSIINLLPWKFDSDGFDHTVVEPYWKELFDFLYDTESKNVDNFLRKVQECLFFLKKERSLLARSVLNLFKEEGLVKQKL